MEWYSSLAPYKSSLKDRQYITNEVIPYLNLIIGGDSSTPDNPTPAAAGMESRIGLDISDFEMHRLMAMTPPRPIDYIIAKASVDKKKDQYYSYLGIEGFLFKAFLENFFSAFMSFNSKDTRMDVAQEDKDIMYMLLFHEVRF